jgi:NIPSNAP
MPKGEDAMILEVRSYVLKPGGVPKALALFAERLPARTRVSPIAGFFHTEIGALNQIHMMWPYADLAERDRLRAVKVEGYPPPVNEFGIELEVRIFDAAPFASPVEPRRHGGLYEIRTYTYGPGSIPHVIDAWATRIDERQKYSPLVFAGTSVFGVQNLWLHIWAYKDWNERQRVRAEVHAAGVWPPKSHPQAVLLRQHNTLVVPAPFSPWQ